MERPGALSRVLGIAPTADAGRRRPGTLARRAVALLAVVALTLTPSAVWAAVDEPPTPDATTAVEPTPGATSEPGPTEETPQPEPTAPDPEPSPTTPSETPAPDETGGPAVGVESKSDPAPGSAAPDVSVRGLAGVFAAGSASTFCTSGVWTVDAAALDIREASSGAIGPGTGWFRDATVDGLAIAPGGAEAYAASVQAGRLSIQRLGAQLGFSELLAAEDTVLTEITAGAIPRGGGRYYFGGYVAEGATVHFELHAYDLAAETYLGRVGRIELPAAANAEGGGDIVFTAQGDLLLLWSDQAGTSSVLASVPASVVPTTIGDTVVAAAVQAEPGRNTPGAPWNGLAIDSVGGFWIQGAGGGDTVLARLDPTTGAVTGAVATPGVVGTDLASCGPSTTLVVRKDVVSRLGADQFTLHVGSAGSSVDLATATTAGTATGIQAEQAGPVPIATGARYTIAESGANGASPGDYTIVYACAWASGGAPFVASAPLGYNGNTGRAQALLPVIPAGHEGDTLTCTIGNTARAPAQTQPTLVLAKELVGTRAAAGDQFRLSVARAGGAELATTTTTGSGSAVGDGSTPAIVAEVGQTYTLSETSTTGDLAAYTATFSCVWSGGGEFARGALQSSDGRMQAQLPAIPGDRNGQQLSCTLRNQQKPLSGLDCSVPTIYAHHRPGSTAGAGRPVNESTGISFGSGVNFDTPTTASGSYNAFALSRDGSQAIAALQGVSGTTLTLRTWNSSTGAVTQSSHSGVTSPAGSATLPGNLVGGAIDPTNGDYYFGGYQNAAAPNASNSQFALFVLRAGATTYTRVGSIVVPGSTTAGGNGDITFDASGNLYLVWSVSGNHRLARADAAQIAAGGVSVATQLTTWSNTGETYNGVAFSGNGKLWVSYSGGIRIIDPANGAVLGNPSSQTGLVDLASCGMPPTMKLEKNVVARVDPGDQFHIEILSGATVVQSATTDGAANGVQPRVAGPMVVTVGQQYTIRETRTGAANSLNNYITSYSCTWSDGDEPVAAGILIGDAATRSQLLPAIPSGKPGQQLICTITNEPLIPATVTVTKTLLDARGGNPTPAAGWEMIVATGAGTGGGASLDPTAAQQTAPGGSVLAPWDLTFGRSDATVDVTVTETQQTGFQFVDGSCTVTPRVGSARVVPVTSETAALSMIRPGERVECELRNQPLPGSASWQKVAEGAPVAHLGGSVWALSGPGVPPGALVTDCDAATAAECPTAPFGDRDPRAGYFRLDDLSKGNHTLVEETAPPGYVRDGHTPHRLVIEVLADPPSCFASAAAGGVPKCLHVDFDRPFINRMQSVPHLPFTGGMSTDAFLIVGGALGALALSVVWFARRRRDAAAWPARHSMTPRSPRP